MLFDETVTQHRLLARQIKKNLGEEELSNPKIQQFLKVVNEAYQEFEEERELIERSMELSSQELTDSLQTLHQQKAELAEAYDSLRFTQIQLEETEKIASLRKQMHEAIEEKNEMLQASEEELKQNLEELQVIQERLQEQKKHLEKALIELQSTQNQLVQSEKMVALGQLVANIAHEINTPLGAITSSINFIADNLQNTIPTLTQFLPTLPTEQAQAFHSLVRQASNNTQVLSSREERQIKRELRDMLVNLQVEDVDWVADTMVDMRIYQDIGVFLPLLQNKDALILAYRLASIQRSASNIQVATQKASKIIFALKSFARQDTTEKQQEANINETLETVLTLYENHLKRGVEVVRHYANLPQTLCYPDELMQVWTNILHNAIQAMNNAGTITINTSFSEENTQILVSIADTGEGIPQEIQAKIFDAFFTTKKMGEGSGLGLDISRKIIDKHKGKIYFQSEEGKGTTFYVEIPFVAVD
jgi:signal transduction histidine kinase